MAKLYVLPFWELFKEEDKRRNLWLVPFCTAGFKITARSAFRASPRAYEARTLAFTILMPVTGGGIIRLAGSEFDITNPSFDPWAPRPSWYPAQVAELQNGYNRAHKVKGRTANMLPAGFETRALPDGTREIIRRDGES
jgi:hypothetical protein